MPRVTAFTCGRATISPRSRWRSALQEVAGADRRVKVVLRPYALGSSGWVER
jgi:hypothetical protein